MTRQRDHELEPLVRRVAPRGRLLRAWPLSGGVTAQVTAFEIEPAGGETRTLVLRWHGA